MHRTKHKETWLEKLANSCPCFAMKDNKLELSPTCPQPKLCNKNLLHKQMTRWEHPPTQKKFLEALLLTGLYTRAECLITLRQVYLISTPRANDIWAQFLKDLNERGMEASRREDHTRYLRVQ